jgi:hypothetical protein
VRLTHKGDAREIKKKISVEMPAAGASAIYSQSNSVAGGLAELQGN